MCIFSLIMLLIISSAMLCQTCLSKLGNIMSLSHWFILPASVGLQSLEIAARGRITTSKLVLFP